MLGTADEHRDARDRKRRAHDQHNRQRLDHRDGDEIAFRIIGKMVEVLAEDVGNPQHAEGVTIRRSADGDLCADTTAGPRPIFDIHRLSQFAGQLFRGDAGPRVAGDARRKGFNDPDGLGWPFLRLRGWSDPRCSGCQAARARRQKSSSCDHGIPPFRSKPQFVVGTAGNFFALYKASSPE
jgi:hypothetical protein